MIMPKNPTEEEINAIISLYLQNQDLQGKPLEDVTKLFYQAKYELQKIHKEEYPLQPVRKSVVKKNDLPYGDEW